ncbi:unnamed protein product [Adineta ricciae]|uniref:G-protein coupled receptors family 1 profile domain-containing protein n=1 Tax=Adineta ricciae TaxID=249248 RepID=A0A815F2P9_ADIRI|nr:unnamed protein product [Adineta ricciae]CAF1319499.1 unnamed protein product [Adineta ricciae]
MAMSGNISTSIDASSYLSDITYLGYYSLSMVILGSIFKLLTFINLCRPAFRNTNARPTIHYMRVLALIDLFAMYGWNLDNYLGLVQGFTFYSSYTVASCKVFSFLNYFTNEASAWLHVFICFDRYLFLSRTQPNTWFNRSKSVLIIIGCVIGVFILANLHFLISVCYEDDNGKINTGSKFYQVFPLYNQIYALISSVIPSVVMMTFSCVSAYYLSQLKQTSTIQNSKIRHRAISITLISTSLLFVITSAPTPIFYGFFYDDLSKTVLGRRVLNIFDTLSYTYPIIDFPIYLITFTEFRRELIRLLIRNRVILPIATENTQRPVPQNRAQNISTARNF